MAKAPKKTGDANTDEASAANAIWSSDKTHVSLRVASGHRYRAGRKLTSAPLIVAKADLTDDQAQAIVADRELIVQEVDAPAEPKAAE